ncbi:hypothetical protein BGZ52_010506 [Haplosporangium bisporale]|nr:hypothetical protein BGZ52_010506 [Haplosporangium bisporale]
MAAVPAYQDSDTFTRIIQFLETSFAFIPGVSHADQDATVEDKLRTIQGAMQANEKKHQVTESQMIKDITRLRAERNKALDDAKRYKTERNCLNVKVESLIAENCTLSADLKEWIKALPPPPPPLPTPSPPPPPTSHHQQRQPLSDGQPPYSPPPNPYAADLQKIIAQTAAAVRDFQAQLDASRQDQGQLQVQLDAANQDRDAARQERDAMSEALARAQSNEVHLRQQLETAMQERDAAARELEWVASVQDQLNQEAKIAQQEREALSAKVKEHEKQAATAAEALRLVTADRSNLSDERDRKNQARIDLEGELQKMTQSVGQTKALLKERSKEVEALKQCLAKRAREAEEEHAKRDETDRKRVRQAVEKAEEETRERWREIENQRTKIEDLKAKITHHAAAAMDYKFKAEKLQSELDEWRARHKKNGVVAA